MLTHISRRYFSFTGRKTIFVAAGSPSHDLQAANFMRDLKKKSNNNYDFVGIGGPLMQAEGLNQSYADINKFIDKPFFPLKNFIRFHVARCYHPYMAPLHFFNKQVLNQVDKSSLLKDQVELSIPSAIITFGNEFFMKKLYVRLCDQYELHNKIRPPTFFYDRSHINQRFEFQDYLDHFFYTIPMKQINFQSFTYPSTCVGHEGVGRAIQYLFQNSKQYANVKSLVTANGLKIASNPKHHREIIEKLVEEQRGIQRARLGINESKNVFLLAPGNTKTEINFAVNLLSRSLEEFFKKPQLTNVSRDHFTVIITADNAQNADFVNQAISNSKYLKTLQTIVTTGEKDKFGAMCAADVGIPLNGELVSECAALQLPSVIISNMNFFYAYITQLYNNFYSDINFAIQGEAYHELVSTAANPYKLSDEIFDLYSDPKLRYHFAERYQNVVHQMIPQANSQDNIVTTDVATLHGVEVQERAFTYETIAAKVLKAARAYESLDKNIPNHQIDQHRKEKLIKAAF
ncbi:hypothetical protein ABPG74_022104 [Tetrahymena malaccensis]